MSDAQARLEALRARFLDRCVEDLRVLEAESDPAMLRPVVHRLAGAAGTFGFMDVSRDAGEVDDALMEGRDPPRDVWDRLVAGVRGLVETRDV